MALIKQKIYKGQSYEYWGLIIFGENKVDNTTTFVMGAFKDQATREEDIKNEMTDLREVRTYDGILTKEQCYTLFKASNAVRLVFKNAVDEVKDEDGNIVVAAEPEIAEDRPNTNWFADAEDA